MGDRRRGRPGPLAPRQGPALPPRILLMWASSGTGPMTAPAAAPAPLRLRVPGARTESHALPDLAGAASRQFYRRTYLALIRRAPHLVGHLYDALDGPGRAGPSRADRVR